MTTIIILLAWFLFSIAVAVPSCPTVAISKMEIGNIIHDKRHIRQHLLFRQFIGQFQVVAVVKKRYRRSKQKEW